MIVYTNVEDSFTKRTLSDLGNYVLINDFEIFKKLLLPRKIAVFSSNLKQDEEAVLNPKLLSEYVDSIYDFCDKIVILISEMHEDLPKIIEKIDRDKIEIFLSGFTSFATTKAKMHFWPFWFLETMKIYNLTPESYKEKYQYFTSKEKYFDCLLGNRKPHRKFIFETILNKNLENKFELSYFKNNNIKENLILDSYINLESKNIEHSMVLVNLGNDNKAMLSSLLPYEIYNRTAYSIIAETNAYNHFNFYTEKTAKPILGKRIFISFAGQHFLKNLKKAGFLTFDNIIDESYDEEENNQKRFLKAFEQIEFLLNSNQELIIEKSIPVVKHNYKVLMETDWNFDLKNLLK
jgi:hypothetical protein